MLAKMKMFARVLVALCCFLLGMTLVGGAPTPGRLPVAVESPARSPVLPQPVASRDADDDDDDEEKADRARARPSPSARTPAARTDDLDLATRDASAMSTVPPRNPERGDPAAKLAVGEVEGTPPVPAAGQRVEPRAPDETDDGEDEEDREEESSELAQDADPAATGDQSGPPPLPEKAVPPSLRKPRIASERLGPPAPPETWTPEQISTAKAVCVRLMNEDAFEFRELEPIREGSCGAPAPISLAALKLEVEIEKEKPKQPDQPPEKNKAADAGKAQTPQAQPVAAKAEPAPQSGQAKPVPDVAQTAATPDEDDDDEGDSDGKAQRDDKEKPGGKEDHKKDGAATEVEITTKELEVEFQPAVTVTCPLAAAVARWNREVVQPKAREHLQDEVVGFFNTSAYQCRTRYNDPGERISYHAFAEALDVSGFTTAKGERVSVEDDWNGTDAKAKFLQEVHAGACRMFGTVLGPRANAAHRNHFHLDMAKRRHSAYCQ